jgi:hypothetical protein
MIKADALLASGAMQGRRSLPPVDDLKALRPDSRRTLGAIGQFHAVHGGDDAVVEGKEHRRLLHDSPSEFGIDALAPLQPQEGSDVEFKKLTP